MRLTLPLTLLSLGVSALVASAAHADTSVSTIKMPSDNVYCYGDDKGVRCDMIVTSNKQPPRPKDCQADYGKLFWLPATGKAERICAGDTVADPGAVTLKYGQKWVLKSVTCESSESGLVCTNRSKNGFRLKRSEQTLF